MCQPASFVIYDHGNKIAWSKYSDSHDDIIRENKIFEGWSPVSKPTAVKIELSDKSQVIRR